MTPDEPGAEGSEALAPEAVASAERPSEDAVVAAEAQEVIPQRCTDPRPHGPHYVAARGTWTGFTCPGPAPDCDLPPADFEHLIPAAGS